jgi:hypothetical protein
MMKIRTLIAISVIIGLMNIEFPSAFAGIKDLLKGVEEAIRGEELSESKIIQGLKEALEIGTGNAVGIVSQVDGYYGDPKMKAP